MKVYCVFRLYGHGNVNFAQWHFYQAYSTRKASQDFCDKKNANNNCSYTYVVKAITVKES